MVDAGFPYYVSGILSQGIELVGSLFDTSPIEDFGNSETRFRNGLKRIYTKPRYTQRAEDFFKYLRGTFVHQLRPGAPFILASCITGARKDMHFKKEGGRIILVIDVLIDDFRKGLESIWKNIEKLKGQIDGKKLDEDFLVILEHEQKVGEGFSYIASLSCCPTPAPKWWPDTPEPQVCSTRPGPEPDA